VAEDFNDRMMIITVDQLMKPVQRRVKQTVVSQVEKFYSGNGFYPYAEAIPGRSCDGSSVATEGYLQLAVVPGCQYAESLGFPQWFAENEWHRMFWAAFDASCQIN